ncbi:MAG: hypothetical protein M1827_004743 [Pycnora praestabilis]|nr:MAG: hypothetical protein M1827_004743 [Pycnora praestabilis]
MSPNLFLTTGQRRVVSPQNRAIRKHEVVSHAFSVRRRLFVKDEDPSTQTDGQFSVTTLSPSTLSLPYTATLVLSNTTTVAIGVATAFDEFYTITLAGPTTLETVISIGTDQSTTSSGKSLSSTSSSSGASTSPSTSAQTSPGGFIINQESASSFISEGLVTTIPLSVSSTATSQSTTSSAFQSTYKSAPDTTTSITNTQGTTYSTSEAITHSTEQSAAQSSAQSTTTITEAPVTEVFSVELTNATWLRQFSDEPAASSTAAGSTNASNSSQNIVHSTSTETAVTEVFSVGLTNATFIRSFGSAPGPGYTPAPIPSNECVLWDSGCTGNVGTAASEFFEDTLDGLLVDPCFLGEGACPSNDSAAAASSRSAVKSWLRAPACTSTWSSWVAGGSGYFPVDETLSLPAGAATIVELPYAGLLIPTTVVGPQVLTISTSIQAGNAPACCGECFVGCPNVQVYYWPTPAANGVCGNNSGSIAAREASEAPRTSESHPMTKSAQLPELKPRFHSIVDNSSLGGSIAVVDGYTFTSPSVYVAFLGLSAADSCGQRGQAYSSTLIAFPTGELSTVVSYPYPGLIFDPTIASFNFADLACPTHTSPSLLFPTQLTTIDPDWQGCTNTVFFTGLDPPTALSAVSNLGPVTTNNAPGGSITALTAAETLEPVTPAVGPTPTPASPDPNIASKMTPSPTPQSNPPSSKPATNLQPSQNQQSPLSSPPAHSQPSQNQQNPSSNPPTNPQLSQNQQKSNNNDPPVMSSSYPGQPAANGASSTASINIPAVVVHGQTVQQNGPPITVDSSVIAYSSGLIHVGTDPTPITMPSQQQTPSPVTAGGFTFLPVQQTPQPAAPQITVGGQSVSWNGPGGAVIIGSATVISGASPVYISSTPISLGPSGLVVGSSIYQVPQASPSIVATIAGQPASVNSAGAVVVAGSTITSGAPPVYISSMLVSLGSPGLVVGTSTYQFSQRAPSIIATVAGQTASVNSAGAVVIAGSTVTSGASAVYVSGTPVSLGPSGLVVASSIYNLPQASYTPIATIAGQTIEVGPSGVEVDGTRLTPGAAPLTISGTPVSLGSSLLIVGSSTITLDAPITTVLTVAGQVFTANPSGFSIAGTTLREGGPGITISGTPVSLNSYGGLVVGTSTIPLESPSSGLGAAILSGLGPIGATPTSTGGSGGVVPFVGGQQKLGIPRMDLLVGWMAFCLVYGFWILG